MVFILKWAHKIRSWKQKDKYQKKQIKQLKKKIEKLVLPVLLFSNVLQMIL